MESAQGNGLVVRDIALAGAGRLAQAFGRLLHERGISVVAVASRTPERAREAAVFTGAAAPVSFGDLPRRSRHILIAVADDAVHGVAQALADAGSSGGIVLQTCGAHGPEVLAPLRKRGVACGTLHPLQTIATPERGVAVLPGSAFAIAGDPDAVAWATAVVDLLGGRPLRLAETALPLYHAAAVMAGNHLIGLLDAAVALMEEAGIDQADALPALEPLVRTSCDNALRLGPREALTGPVARGDAGTVSRHLSAMKSVSPLIRELYRVASLQLLELARCRGLPEEELQDLRRVLRDNK